MPGTQTNLRCQLNKLDFWHLIVQNQRFANQNYKSQGKSTQFCYFDQFVDERDTHSFQKICLNTTECLLNDLIQI